MVKTGKTKDPFLTLCGRNIWLLTAFHDIDLQIHHVPGCHNIVADALSRVYSNSTVDDKILQKLREQYIGEQIPSS